MATLQDEIKAAVTPAPGNEGQSLGLLGSVAFVGTVFTALGVTTELTGRMVREQAGLSIVAVVGGGLAAICGMAATALYSTAADRVKQHRLYVFGFLVLGLATVAAALAAGFAQRTRARPTVAAQVVGRTDGGRLLRVAATSDGLHSGDSLSMIVERLNRRPATVTSADGSRTGVYRYVRGRPLYGASIGSDRNGHAAESVGIPLPPGVYGDIGVQAWVGAHRPCYNEGSGTTGCVAMQIIRVREAPQIDGRWIAARRIMRLRISARDIPFRAVTLDVAGRGGRPPDRHLAQFVLAPDRSGSFARALDVPVPRDVHSVCAVAFTRRPKAGRPRRRVRCPAGQGTAIGWLRLATGPVSRRRRAGTTRAPGSRRP